MNITQTFYNNLATRYDKLFLDWYAATKEQAEILDRIFADNGFDRTAKILDCACGIGTQAIGLAALGYSVTASDISDGALAEAAERADEHDVVIRFECADFCALSDTFSEQFDIVIAMDNALPHMLTSDDLGTAVRSITGRLKPGGIFVASIRDYDSLLAEKPPYSPPYIHKTESGQRVSFQTWDWDGDKYKLTQYIIDDESDLQTGKFVCEYRAVRREELTNLLLSNGCGEVIWMSPEETGFYQPIVVARCGEKNVEYRILRDDETELLKDFLYEAIFIPEGAEPPDRSIVYQPELAIYYEDFGKGKADNCIIAEVNGKAVGAVWTRIMNDYGHVYDDIPSFAISLYKEYRSMGFGTEMMRRMLDLLKEQGFEKASLAVQKANYAVKMYEKLGFRTVDENDEEYIMVNEL